MVIAIYTVLLLTCSLTLGVFGFFVGRCGVSCPSLMTTCPGLFTVAKSRRGNAVPDRGPTLSYPAVPGTCHGSAALTWPHLDHRAEGDDADPGEPALHGGPGRHGPFG